MDKYNFAGMLSLDCSKAFDMIRWSSIVRSLKTAGASSHVLKWTHDYLNGRSCQIEPGDSPTSIDSAVLRPTRGIPQGSVLGPMLFAVGLSLAGVDCIRNTYSQYADDLTLCAGGDTPAEVRGRLSTQFQAVKSVIDDCGLILNASKSHFMMVGSAQRLSRLEEDDNHILLEGSRVKRETTMRLLGVLFDERMSFFPHISEAAKKARGRLRYLYRQATYLPTKTRKLLYLAFVYPLVTYADATFFMAQATASEMLERVHNSAARWITGDRRLIHGASETALKTLGWRPLSEKRLLHMGSQIWASLNDPMWPRVMQVRRSSGSVTRLAQSRGLLLPKFHLKARRASFRVGGAKLWNSLPERVRNSMSLSEFRERFDSQVSHSLAGVLGCARQ